ncbi:MAG: hypothetical protein A3B70_07355 [Deltaproteobacteria bacterium RIFCSPHIGHO2_02_FULL_40_11]|nr:MAG: hypothetical protein A3B70_07355 [Deltaproteobacteria bacterium RIFCSPHIGHO2_02_FULL_40_11]
MEIQEKKINDIVVLRLSGRIDAFTSEKLEEEINSIMNTGQTKFIVNFEDVNYISSSGLRVFLGAYKTLLQNKGVLRFSAMPDPVLKIFALAGFDKIFGIYPTDQKAIEDFEEPAPHRRTG